MEGIDLGDHALKEVGLGVLLEVNIAHLDDAEALKGVREIADGDGAVGDLEFVACERGGIGGEADASSGGGGDKTAARKRWSLRIMAAAWNTLHSP